jgi:hypothetical protein
MNIDVIWDNDEKTIVRYRFKPRWNWGDLHVAMKEASALVDTVTQGVDVIMDVTSASLIPSGAISQAQKAFATVKNPRIGTTVVVSSSVFAQALVSVGRKLSGNAANNWDMEFVSTVAEAYQILEKKSNRPKEVQP